MAIQYNDITAIGDVFEIKSNTPIIGIQGVSGYTDDVLNETATRYFTREFRFSRNGITYTEWQPLTNTNLQNEFIDETDIFDVQYRYTRAGTDGTGFLTFNSISLTGAITAVANPKIFTDLYFNKFFNYNDDGVLRWALNVLDKLYKRGVIANYIERGEVTNEDDDDYLAFFGAITHFFAIIVRYAREFKDFTLNDVLLLEYLKQKNVFLCDDMSLSDLQNVLSNLYINFLERGTNEIVKQAGEDGRVYDGELLRLICKSDVDEFLFGLIEKEKTIWNANNNSPLYKGTKGAINLVKAYEFEQDIQNLTSYPLIEDSYITKYTDGDKDVIRILDAAGTVISGIGDAENQSKLILIDPRVGYEITFQLKQAILGDYLHLKVNLYDKDEVLLADSPISAITGAQTNLAIDKETLNRNDLYYFIRIILFNQITSPDAKHSLDVGFGNHLIINNSLAKYMSIELGVDITGGGAYDANNDLRIWDFKVRPLVENYANGFVMIPNIITSFIENNSEEINQVVENKIKRFLIPYNTILKNQFLDELYTQEGVPLQITVVVTDETILGVGNGSITITAIGGTQPYLYSIDNGVTFYDTNIFTNLTAGSYDIVVQDAESVQVTDTAIVNSGVTDLSIEAFATPASKLDIADGVITILASGGVSPYYYSINGVDYQVSNVFNNVLANNYTAYVKDTSDNIKNTPVIVTAIRDLLLTVNVEDESAVLQENVSVRVFNASGFDETYLTDVNGQFTVYLELGGYNLTFTKSGFKTKNVTNLSIIEDRVYDVVMVRYYTLTFNVTNSVTGLKIVSFTVSTIFTPEGQDAFTFLGEIGNETKGDLLAGDYSFKVVREGFFAKTVPLFTLSSNDTLDIELIPIS